MAAAEPEAPKDVTANELKELERVFEFLCDFAPKNKLNNLLKPKLERKQKILSYKKNPEAVKLVDDTGRELSDDLIDAELQRLEEEIGDVGDEVLSWHRAKVCGEDPLARLADLSGAGDVGQPLERDL